MFDAVNLCKLDTGCGGGLSNSLHWRRHHLKSVTAMHPLAMQGIHKADETYEFPLVTGSRKHNASECRYVLVVSFEDFDDNGRGGGIRTRDFLLPKQALYQAELRPVTTIGSTV